MKLWNEICAKFLLDLAKIVFTTLIMGKILTSNIDWLMFTGGTILLVALVWVSYSLTQVERKRI